VYVPKIENETKKKNKKERKKKSLQKKKATAKKIKKITSMNSRYTEQ